MESLDKVSRILEYRNYTSLTNLLSQAYVEFDVSTQYGSYAHSSLTTAEIYAPFQEYERLKELSDGEQQPILDAILDVWPPEAYGMEITGILFKLNTDSLIDESDEYRQAIQQLERIQNTLIAVSTGGPRIQSVNQDYHDRYSLFTERLETLGIQNRVPYSDLWDWYGKWSSGDLPTYQSRREYIRGLLDPLKERLLEGPSPHGAEMFPGPTGWSLVDRQLGEARKVLESASTEEQFQSVGLHCRESLISLAQTVFDPDQHPPIDRDNVSVSDTDAKRKLDRFLAVEVSGSSNAQARRLAKVSLDLANELQHRRTATFQHAALCAQATTSVVNIIAILSGVRDPSDNP